MDEKPDVIIINGVKISKELIAIIDKYFSFDLEELSMYKDLLMEVTTAAILASKKGDGYLQENIEMIAGRIKHWYDFTVELENMIRSENQKTC